MTRPPSITHFMKRRQFLKTGATFSGSFALPQIAHGGVYGAAPSWQSGARHFDLARRRNGPDGYL
jgi:hypothetical protein